MREILKIAGTSKSERRGISKHKADIGCCNFVEHEIELEEAPFPIGKAQGE